jgi:hypothetical protein
MVHRCMIKSAVMWLRILVVSLLCVYVALFESKKKILYLLTAIGLTPGCNSTLHIYKQYIEQNN